MPSTVESLFAAANLTPEGVVSWRTPLLKDGPGVDVVALTAETTSTADALPTCPIDSGALERTLDARPELTVDGERPSIAELSDRLASFWLPDEVVLYIGLAGTSLAKRVGQYYVTALGARSPHAGGWFLKTLSVLPELQIHYAGCSDPTEAEDQMIQAFCAGVSAHRGIRSTAPVRARCRRR